VGDNIIGEKSQALRIDDVLSCISACMHYLVKIAFMGHTQTTPLIMQHAASIVAVIHTFGG